MTVSRREGRRSLSAYGSHARGVRVMFVGERTVPSHRASSNREWERAALIGGAAFALALLSPLVRSGGSGGWKASTRASPAEGDGEQVPAQRSGGERDGMKRKPSIGSLETVSLEEAIAYLEHSSGDEVTAAVALAWDRNRLDGSLSAPDDAEVHHALFLLCRARGMRPPSFDAMRVELRRRVAA
ncbi:MAG: hypothetical protein ABSC94_12120 [Polyangiaceae bacterium]